MLNRYNSTYNSPQTNFYSFFKSLSKNPIPLCMSNNKISLNILSLELIFIFLIAINTKPYLFCSLLGYLGCCSILTNDAVWFAVMCFKLFQILRLVRPVRRQIQFLFGLLACHFYCECSVVTKFNDLERLSYYTTRTWKCQRGR